MVSQPCYLQPLVAVVYGKYSDPSSPGTLSWLPCTLTATLSATVLIATSCVKSFDVLLARDLRLGIDPLLPACSMG